MGYIALYMRYIFLFSFFETSHVLSDIVLPIKTLSGPTTCRSFRKQIPECLEFSRGNSLSLSLSRVLPRLALLPSCNVVPHSETHSFNPLARPSY